MAAAVPPQVEDQVAGPVPAVSPITLGTQSMPMSDGSGAWEFSVADPGMDPAEESKMAKAIIERVKASLGERGPLEENWRKWQVQFNSETMRKDIPKGSEWEADFDMGITFERSRAVTSRIANPMIQQRPVLIAEETEPEYAALAAAIEEFLDIRVSQMRNPSFREFVERFLTDQHIYTYGVAKVPHFKEERTILEWQSAPQRLAPPEGGMAMPPGPGVAPPLGAAPPGGAGPMLAPPPPPPPGPTMPDILPGPDEVQPPAPRMIGRLAPATYTSREGAFPVNVSPEKFGWYPLRASSLDAAECVFELFDMAPHQVKRHMRSRYFRPIYDKLRKSPEEGETPNKAEAERNETAGLTSAKQSSFRFVEAYTSREIPDPNDPTGTTEQEEIWVIDWNSEEVIRHVVNFFSDYRIPYFVKAWEPWHDSIVGASFCGRLEGAHRAFSGSLCQRYDMASRANANAWATDDDDFADEFEGRTVRPGEVIRLSNLPKDRLMEMKLMQPYSQLPNIEEVIERHADITSALNQSALGIETVNRPTQGGTIRQLEEAQQPLYSQLEMAREFVATVFMCVIDRTRQFFPEGARYWVRDAATGMKAEKRLKFPVGLVSNMVTVRVKASTSDMNESARKQEAIGLLDRLEKFYPVQAQLANAASQPNPAAQVMLDLANAHQASWQRVLQMFRVADATTYVPPISKEAILGAQVLFNAVQQQQAIIQNLTGRLAQLLGQPGGEPGGGTPPGKGEEAGQGGDQGAQGGPGMGRVPGPALPQGGPPAPPPA